MGSSRRGIGLIEDDRRFFEIDAPGHSQALKPVKQAFSVGHIECKAKFPEVRIISRKNKVHESEHVSGINPRIT